MKYTEWNKAIPGLLDSVGIQELTAKIRADSSLSASAQDQLIGHARFLDRCIWNDGDVEIHQPGKED